MTPKDKHRNDEREKERDADRSKTAHERKDGGIDSKVVLFFSLLRSALQNILNVISVGFAVYFLYLLIRAIIHR